MKLWKLALGTAALVAAMATPAMSAGYVKYTCGTDGYTFGVERHGGTSATIKDAEGNVTKAYRKGVQDGERYAAEGADVWMKDNDAVITVGGNAKHAGCTIARFAAAPAVNYICSTGYTFATHLSAPGKLDYIDSFGNSASLDGAAAKGHMVYKGTAVTGMTIDLSLANNQASLTTNRGSNGLYCEVKK